MKKLMFVLFLAFSCFSAYGQETAHKSLFYPTDGYKLSHKQKTELKAFLDSVLQAGRQLEEVSVQGNTDSAASYWYNVKLSQRRSGGVQRFLTESGVDGSKIRVNSYGESKPAYTYTKAGAMAKNRRVDVDVVYTQEEQTTILDLYKLLEAPADTFLIFNHHDTALRVKNGTVISIPRFTICGMEHSYDMIKVAVKEVTSLGQMISQNTSTGSGTNLLITGGMLQLTAFTMKNDPLQICDGKSVTVLLPTESPDENMQLFFASRDKNYGLDWNLAGSARLDFMNSSSLDTNYGNFACGGDDDFCPLFTCKIRMAIKRFVYRTFTSKRKMQLRNFTAYQMRNTSNALAAMYQDRAKKLEELEEKFKDPNIERLKDLTRDDANYYIFNAAQLGWINCDRYIGLPPARLATVTLPMEATATTDVKLILRANRAIMPSYDINGKVGFPNLPKGEKATLLGLRYAKGQPALALREITIGDKESDLELEFKDYSLEELKGIMERLKN